MLFVFMNFLMAYMIGLAVVLSSLYLNFNYIYKNSLSLQNFQQNYNKLMDKKQSKIYESLLPFECGFKPFVNNSNPLTVEFFAVILLFLMFDLEMLSILPSLHLTHSNNILFTNEFFTNLHAWNTILILLIFLFFVLFGLYDEKSSNLIVKLKLKNFR